MPQPDSRVRGTAKSPPTNTSSASTAPTGPGGQAVREALGDDAYDQLRAQAARDGAMALLAELTLYTALEADRLYGRLRLQAAQARDHLTDALDDRRTAGFLPASGVLGTCGHSADMLAARTTQQLNQLALVLDTYQAASRPTT
ncbi:hypothetical protein [Streptomyces sp. MZ04]|uniref:hypothetical protein n=1 Tax=Streptomyces sp. MZ04 TaxID=2559236 RepID=UPI00107E7F7E|nr:hypothetical protein [Streptomyces sp. MZ04]TGB00869.1 hypothetical protein E2651_28205 [Streptomyces sp. MZ04]